jgi:c(7)-type cytochrome triheme protein
MRKQIYLTLIVCLGFSVIPLPSKAVASENWRFPPLPPPWEYGNLLLDRVSSSHGQKPVFFSHWQHRLKYACQVCHSELEFEMRAGYTGISEADNRDGMYCGACHNGKTAFDHSKKNCSKCHNGNIAYNKKDFKKLAKFPKAKYGNKIDWAAALHQGLFKPKKALEAELPKQLKYNEKLSLDAEHSMVSPAGFEHKEHTEWMDCGTCHPDIFDVKTKGTKNFSMDHIFKGKFCGACHRDIAFPINDCGRCHPGLKS